MTIGPIFQRARGRRVSDEIVASIRTDVASGKLKVGSRLPSERALAERFGVSRGALRESLRSLEHAGLIRLKKGTHGGAIVQDCSGDAVSSGLEDLFNLGVIKPHQLTEARVMLETVIIRLACRHATPADLDALNALIDAAEQSGAAGDFDQRIDLNIQFHRQLSRIAANPIMIAVMDAVLNLMVRFIYSIAPYEDTLVTPSRRRFMAHFAAGDVEASVKEMESLLRALEEQYLSRIDNPDGASRR